MKPRLHHPLLQLTPTAAESSRLENTRRAELVRTRHRYQPGRIDWQKIQIKPRSNINGKKKHQKIKRTSVRPPFIVVAANQANTHPTNTEAGWKPPPDSTRLAMDGRLPSPPPCSHSPFTDFRKWAETRATHVDSGLRRSRRESTVSTQRSLFLIFCLVFVVSRAMWAKWGGEVTWLLFCF